MRKIYALGLALVAMLAFSAVVVASASAEEFLAAENLIKGEKIATGVELPALIEGKILLRDPVFGAHIECSFHAELDIGFIFILVLDVLTLLNITTGTPLAGEPLLCTNVSGSSCETSATDIETWPIGLPWTLETVLAEPSGKFFSLLVEPTAEKAGYEVLCLILGIAASEECKVVVGTGSEVVNVAGGTEAKGEVTPLANCSVGGKEKGEEEFLAGNLTTSSEGLVSVSE